MRLGAIAVLVLLLSGACTTVSAPRSLALRPVDIPEVFTPGEEHRIVFDLVNDGLIEEEVCVVGGLSFTLRSPDDERFALLLPYHGNISHGCSEKVRIDAGGTHRYSLFLTLVKTAAAGNANLEGHMTIADRTGREWQTLRTGPRPVTVSSSD